MFCHVYSGLSLCDCFQVKKLQSIVQHRDAQYRHDLRKREREMSRLKDKLHQLLTDKNQDKRIGMTRTNKNY